MMGVENADAGVKLRTEDPSQTLLDEDPECYGDKFHRYKRTVC